MERWTRVVLRFRWPILAGWLVVLLAGGFAFTHLSSLLSNEFSVPGTDSERARTILERHFGDRSDGAFTLVFRLRDGVDRASYVRLQRDADRAARVVPDSTPRQLVPAGRKIVYGDVVSTLSLAKAKGYTDELYRALPHGGGVQSYVTGQAAIQHDLDPIFSKDLRKGEMIALPIAVLVLLAVFGLSVAVTMPFIFAACTVMATLGGVYVYAHFLTTATYVTNLVFLIGLGIAIDYSLLVTYRFREELARSWPANAPAESRDEVETAIVRTMKSAGRAVVFSGATVAIGLALLLFIPLPFVRSIGVGGFLIPLASIAAALTLQPALLSLYGRRGVARIPLLPKRFRAEEDTGFWHRLAGAIMRRPVAFLAGGAVLLVAAAIPVFGLQLTPGSASGIPQFPQSVRGFDVLKHSIGPGAISPTQVVVDSGRAGAVREPGVQAAIGRLAGRIRADRETASLRVAPRPPFVDRSGRYEELIVAGRDEYGSEAAQSFVHRLRGKLIPAAEFPSGVRVLAGGGPPQGVDFLEQAYRYFPWLVAAVLVLTYFLLMRAFRSALLPLKAVILNLLSVGAAYGMLVVVFRWGVGSSVLGLYQIGQVEGWIPIFLFAMLFGLSMDYEVFLVIRMREEWDHGRDNRGAVAYGLERTGRIVTAAAIVMVAAFSGFVAGRIVGLQEFGIGLAVAIFLDATLVRAVLVPSLMALFGRYNWWLPGPLARVVRVPESPLEQPRRPALRPAGR
ncbi:MAG: MMPL family transporter [Actinobacteria bacterium]|nr:MAG: MMPL family transporter [Actinomycetota bacterium]